VEGAKEVILPLRDLDRISEIAKERYLSESTDKAFPFAYALPVPKIGSVELVYQEVLVDYRHDIGVYIDLRKE
jgi:hypothetical protein